MHQSPQNSNRNEGFLPYEECLVDEMTDLGRQGDTSDFLNNTELLSRECEEYLHRKKLDSNPA